MFCLTDGNGESYLLQVHSTIFNAADSNEAYAKFRDSSLAAHLFAAELFLLDSRAVFAEHEQLAIPADFRSLPKLT